MESLKAYVLIANRRMCNDGIRSALGLGVENHYAYPVILNGEFPKFSDHVSGKIRWIKELDGQLFTCGAPVPEDAPAPEDPEFPVMMEIDLQELGERMREADVIIPYGLPKQTSEPPPACAESE